MNAEQAVRDYATLARSMAAHFYFPGADRDDVEQEALMGLLKAARDYRDDHEIPFRAFACLCIRRQLLTALTRSRRQKHTPLSLAQREIRDETGGRPLSPGDAIACPRASSLVDDRATLRNVFAEMRALTEVERRCVVGFACGLSYGELGAQFGYRYKTIDNALTRARHKLRAAA